MNWDRVERLIGVEALNHLRGKKVVIIGLGSGGGFVATGLAMSGIQKFILIDNDTIDPENIVRHVADQREVGRSKVEALRDLIHFRNPAAEMIAIHGRIEDHQDQLDGVDLVISAVDGEGTKFQINELCLQKNLPAIYAGVYERGEGGDVTIIQPFNGPCYACWAAHLRDGYISPSPDGSGKLDYGLLNERGTLDAEPGLWLHVVRVAAAQADMALNFLLKDTPSYRQLPANTVVLANNALEIIEGTLTPPYSAEWINIQRDPYCMVCGDKHLSSAREALSLDELANDMISFDEGDNHEQRES